MRNSRQVTAWTFVPALPALTVAMLLHVFVTYPAFLAFAVLVIATGFLYDWSKKWTLGRKRVVVVVMAASWLVGLVFIATQIGARLNA